MRILPPSIDYYSTSPAWLVSSTQTLRSFEPKNVIANDLHIWEALSPGFTSNMKIPCVDFTDLLDMATGMGQPDVRRALNHFLLFGLDVRLSSFQASNLRRHQKIPAKLVSTDWKRLS